MSQTGFCLWTHQRVGWAKRSVPTKQTFPRGQHVAHPTDAPPSELAQPASESRLTAMRMFELRFLIKHSEARYALRLEPVRKGSRTPAPLPQGKGADVFTRISTRIFPPDRRPENICSWGNSSSARAWHRLLS